METQDVPTLGARRVTLLVSNFPPEIGSAARLFAELSEGLATRGFGVTVVAPTPRKMYAKSNAQGDVSRRHRQENPRIVRVRTFTAPQSSVFGRALEHFVLALALPLRAITIARSTLLVYSPPLPLAATSILLAKLKRCVSIVNVQDLYPQTAIDAGMMKPGFAERMLHHMAAWVYGHANYVVTHSEGNAAVVASEGRGNTAIRVIHNWADQAIEKGPESSAGKMTTPDFVVVYAGIMSYHQDLETIVRAAALLTDDHSTRFMLIGGGPAKSSLQHLAAALSAQNIVFGNAQPPPEYAKLLASANVAIVSLKREVSTPVVPSKLFDIMASGVACVALVPRTSDAAKIVIETGCGVVLEPGKPDELAAELRHLRRSLPQVRTMGEAGRNAYTKLYSFGSALESYTNLLGEASDDRSPPAGLEETQ